MYDTERGEYVERHKSCTVQIVNRVQVPSKHHWRWSLTAVAALVRIVPAVVRPIAHPEAVDAVVVGTLKLGGRTELVCKEDVDNT